jgi:hypothetical protein
MKTSFGVSDARAVKFASLLVEALEKGGKVEEAARVRAEGKDAE